MPQKEINSVNTVINFIPDDDKEDNSKNIDQIEPIGITEDDENDETPLIKAFKRSKAIPTDVYHTSKNETAKDILKVKGYLLEEDHIGSGGFGKVYKGIKTSKKRSSPASPTEDKSSDLIVACKVIELKKNRKKKIEELKHELYVLETVSHENMVKLFEHFIIDENVYIFMELAEGGNLADYVRTKGPLNESVSRKFFKQICDAVYYMHKMKISHRDLKLANVLLDSTKSQCKVTDFGLSRVVFCEKNGILYCKSYCGTTLYMAPEIMRIKKTKAAGQEVIPYDPFKADIWALGICLYAMLNRAWPFNDEKADILERMMAKDWRFVKKIRKSITNELRHLLENMIEPNPSKRIDFFGIFSHSWMDSKRNKSLIS
ncbi:Testis-specific serine/threonine-protein kinase 2 [Halotydeus destructor]|nr:Testis-specific serine/threonine-protein kinase 2 [Halotydeus destructor]